VSAPAPLLELRAVTVRAQERTILAVPRLAIDGVATTAVLGANGAGKSTLLRVAGALIAPDEGMVLLDGEPATQRALRAATAAVLQRPLLRRAGVRANVETGLRFRGVARAESRRRGEEWLERLGIAQLAQRPAHTLSGGEAQRVSLARAFAVEPRLLLLDEPFAALDAPTRGDLLADLRDTLAETATAALLVTHDRHEAAALADWIAVLHAGELRQQGRVEDVWDQPADEACARILGFENVLAPALATRLLGERCGATALRASDCSPAPAGSIAPGDDDLVAPATFRKLVPLGASSRVVAEIDGHRLLATADAPPPAWLADAEPGQGIVVRVPRARLRAVGVDRDARASEAGSGRVPASPTDRDPRCTR